MVYEHQTSGLAIRGSMLRRRTERSSSAIRIELTAKRLTTHDGLVFQLWKRCSIRDRTYVMTTPVVATITNPTKTLEV